MKFVQTLMQQGYLIEPAVLKSEIINKINSVDENILTNLILDLNPPKLISKDFILSNIEKLIEKLKINPNKKFQELVKCLSTLYLGNEKLKKVEETKKIEFRSSRGIVITEEYPTKAKKLEVIDFVHYFRNRFDFFKKLLQDRKLEGLTSIGKLYGNRRRISVIGLVYQKRYTKNNNLLLEIEDMTGRIRVVFNKERKELFEKAENIVLDEVIAVSGSGNDEIIFANDVLFADVGLRELKRSSEEAYAVFPADLHVGSDKFLEKNFLKFISWINGEIGNDKQKEIAKKIKYLFMPGDLVDSIGVYPAQEKELLIKDVYEQYKYCANLLGKIRKDVTIILCPGNHDAVRLIEPQPKFDPEISSPLFEMENVVITTNPSIVNIGRTKTFNGFNILMYHGRSVDYYMNQVDSLRIANAKLNPGLVLNFLLKKRHLAPGHSCTTILPYDKDFLALRTIPDVIVTGHVHRSAILNYNGILAISCACWQAKTPYQDKLGHEPDPCKACLLNLKTRKINVLDFS